ncbi:MAG: hypothetical protein RR748_23825, partial [Pseudomonas sp.]
SLLAKAVDQSPSTLNEKPHSRAGSLPQGPVLRPTHSDFTGTKMTRRSLDRQANGLSIERPLTPACLLFTR